MAVSVWMKPPITASSWGGEDTGIVSYAGNTASFTSDLTKQSTAFTFAVVPNPPSNVMSFLGGRDGQIAISLARPGIGLSMLAGASQGPQFDRQLDEANTAATPVFDATRTSLDVTAQGRYSYKFDFPNPAPSKQPTATWTQTAREGTA